MVRRTVGKFECSIRISLSLAGAAPTEPASAEPVPQGWLTYLCVRGICSLCIVYARVCFLSFRFVLVAQVEFRHGVVGAQEVRCAFWRLAFVVVLVFGKLAKFGNQPLCVRILSAQPSRKLAPSSMPFRRRSPTSKARFATWRSSRRTTSVRVSRLCAPFMMRYTSHPRS